MGTVKRGLPDYLVPGGVVAARMVDNAQLLTAKVGAAQLDGRGRLFWFDNFREGLGGWALTNVANGIKPYLTTERAEIPPASLRFDTGSNGATDKSSALRYTYLPGITRVGIDYSLNMTGTDGIFTQEIFFHDGTLHHLLIIEYHWVNDTVKVTEDGGTHTVAALPFTIGDVVWMGVKVVIDMEDYTVPRLIIGQSEIDTAGWVLDTFATTHEDRLVLQHHLTTSTAARGYAWLGHLMITLDEP